MHVCDYTDSPTTTMEKGRASATTKTVATITKGEKEQCKQTS